MKKNKPTILGACKNCGCAISPHYDLCSHQCETELRLKRRKAERGEK